MRSFLYCAYIYPIRAFYFLIISLKGSIYCVRDINYCFFSWQSHIRMNRQEIAQQLRFRIFNLLKDRLRSNPKKQFKTAISVRFLAYLKKRFGVTGRFKSNRPLECYFVFPESRVIRGNFITYPQNIQVRVSNPKKDGDFISLPYLVIRFFTVSNYW